MMEERNVEENPREFGDVISKIKKVHGILDRVGLNLTNIKSKVRHHQRSQSCGVGKLENHTDKEKDRHTPSSRYVSHIPVPYGRLRLRNKVATLSMADRDQNHGGASGEGDVTVEKHLRNDRRRESPSPNRGKQSDAGINSEPDLPTPRTEERRRRCGSLPVPVARARSVHNQRYLSQAAENKLSSTSSNKRPTYRKRDRRYSRVVARKVLNEESDSSCTTSDILHDTFTTDARCSENSINKQDTNSDDSSTPTNSPRYSVLQKQTDADLKVDVALHTRSRSIPTKIDGRIERRLENYLNKGLKSEVNMQQTHSQRPILVARRSRIPRKSHSTLRKDVHGKDSKTDDNPKTSSPAPKLKQSLIDHKRTLPHNKIKRENVPKPIRGGRRRVRDLLEDQCSSAEIDNNTTPHNDPRPPEDSLVDTHDDGESQTVVNFSDIDTGSMVDTQYDGVSEAAVNSSDIAPIRGETRLALDSLEDQCSSAEIDNNTTPHNDPRPPEDSLVDTHDDGESQTVVNSSEIDTGFGSEISRVDEGYEVTTGRSDDSSASATWRWINRDAADEIYESDPGSSYRERIVSPRGSSSTAKEIENHDTNQYDNNDIQCISSPSLVHSESDLPETLFGADDIKTGRSVSEITQLIENSAIENQNMMTSPKQDILSAELSFDTDYSLVKDRLHRYSNEFKNTEIPKLESPDHVPVTKGRIREQVDLFEKRIEDGNDPFCSQVPSLYHDIVKLVDGYILDACASLEKESETKGTTMPVVPRLDLQSLNREEDEKFEKMRGIGRKKELSEQSTPYKSCLHSSMHTNCIQKFVSSTRSRIGQLKQSKLLHIICSSCKCTKRLWEHSFGRRTRCTIIGVLYEIFYGVTTLSVMLLILFMGISIPERDDLLRSSEFILNDIITFTRAGPPNCVV
ncbi:uncharacterized protein LOC120340882 [Styela clava]